MRKTLLAMLALLAAPLLSGSTLVVKNYDVDSLSYYYPILCTPTVGTAAGECPGSGYPEARKITTSGVASTTVTSVSSNDAFDGVAAGDVLLISPDGSDLLVPALRYVSAKASADSITVDSNVTISAGGSTFRFWRLTAGTGAAEDGWFSVGAGVAMNALVDIVQVSDTDGIDYQLQCRQALPGGGYSLPYSFTATNKTSASVSAAAWSLSGTGQGPWDQCRVGLKITTGDDDVITISNGVNDDIDFKEYVNSYTIAGSNKIDFVEDAGGTPNVCVAAITAATYTGATLATEITTQMNAAACTPTNTYLATYSTTTHKFTIARATGALSVDLLWNSGVNTATSAKTILGYANVDDTAGTSYVSDNVTGESAELTATLAAGIYATGTEACVEVVAKMQAQAVASTISCSYSATTDKITLSATGITQLMVLWNSGTNNATSADTALGFGADNTGALTYTGTAIGLNAANEIEKVTVTVGVFK